MRSAVAIPFLAALATANAAAASVVDFDLIFSKAPQYKSAKPTATSVNVKKVAASIEAKLLAAHPTAGRAASTTTKAKTITTKTSSKKSSSKPKSTKKAVKTTKKSSVKTTKTTSSKKRTSSVAAASKNRRALVHAHGHKKRQATTTTSQPACVSQAIYYTYTPSPNNATGFLTDSTLRNIASNALAPVGFTRNFNQQYGSLFASNYLGYYQLGSYNTTTCTNLCSAFSGCTAVNMYFERDPVVNPGPSCDNPTAGVSVRCALWGASISVSQALNVGEWRTNFMVVIQGSNGYTGNIAPPAQTNFTGPQALAGAISTSTGATYIGQTFLSGSYDVSFCSKACQNATISNRQAAGNAGNSTFSPCNLYNTFKVNYNGTLVGTYCKMYTTTAETANGNQYSSTSSSGTTYDLDNSYAYALTAPDNGTVPASMIATKTSSTTSTTASATPQSATLVASCAQVNSTGTFVNSNGVTYVARCASDLQGVGDLSNKQVTSYAGCSAACDTTTNCQGFAYVTQNANGAGICYFKNLRGVTTQPNSNANVDLAWQQGTYSPTK